MAEISSATAMPYPGGIAVPPARWPAPELGASLLVALSPPALSASQNSDIPARRTALIVGQGRLAAVRTFACLEAGLEVVITPTGAGQPDAELQYRIASRQVQIVAGPSTSVTQRHCSQRQEQEQIGDNPSTLRQWEEYLDLGLPVQILDDLVFVCITDTISTAGASTSTYSARSPVSALAVRKAFYKRRIPVNVADYPDLSDFHFPATHRFPLLPGAASASLATSSGGAPSSADSTASRASSFAHAQSPKAASPLQIAITTNGSSCRFASRLRREIVSKLPKGVGSAVAKIGELRQEARNVQRTRAKTSSANSEAQWQLDNNSQDLEQGEREEGWSATLLNKPVPQISSEPTSIPSSSKCTSANRRKGPVGLLLPPLDKQTGRPLHPSQLPLTPPATPPLHAVAMQDGMEGILSGDKLESLVPPSLTRMRFIAQIAEYWPIERLAALSQAESQRVLSLYPTANKFNSMATAPASPVSTSGQITSDASGSNCAQSAPSASAPTTSAHITIEGTTTPRHGLALENEITPTPEREGKVFLLGSGPGSPALLTMAAHTLLTKHATLILSDKLVPSEILSLIPPSIPLVIAKKFPGNAEGAQNELMDLAYQGALKGETVVRLKQGDPYVYGRGGEEVLFFRERGFEAVVVPGISSAFAAPLMAGIPVTQRGVSESVTVTTGVGRKGKGVKLPGYERSRTLTVLMGVARLEGVVNALTSADGSEGNGREGGGRQGAAYPPYCPIAIIEKASSPDQRLVASTLEGIVAAMESVGEQRPPGMMIIGWSVLALEGKGDVDVLDGTEGLPAAELEDVDRKRVHRWLKGQSSIVREGLDSSWSELVNLQAAT